MLFSNAMINTIISSVGDNPNLCGSDSCKKKKNSAVVPIIASIGGLLIMSLIVAAILFGIRKRRRKQQAKTEGENFNYKIHVDIDQEKNLVRYELIKHAHDYLCSYDGR